MKKTFLIAAALIAAAFEFASCGNKNANQTAVSDVDSTAEVAFDFEGSYQTPSTDSVLVGYYQTLSINKADSLYDVVFSASKLKDKEACSFEGRGKLVNDTIYVTVPDDSKEVIMTIFPTKDRLGVEVGTKDEEDRLKLNYYCAGGGSLVGQYVKNIVSSDAVGAITKNMTVADLLKMIPEKQIQKTVGHGEHADDVFDDYKLFDEDGNLLLTLTPEKQNDSTQTINRVLINNLMYHTDKGIGRFSTFADIKKAYPDFTFESDKENVTMEVKELNAWFVFSKKDLKEGWWNEKTQSVDVDKIPDNAKVQEMILWWK